MCEACANSPMGIENGTAFVGGVKREPKTGWTETVYLPGDRLPTMLANAIYRDAKLNWQEARAKWLATDCAMDRHYKAKYGSKWICTFKSPCRHCRQINN